MTPTIFKILPLGQLLEDMPRNGYSPACLELPTGKWVLGLSALDGRGLNLSGRKSAPPNDPLVDKFLLRPGDFLISRSNTSGKVGRVGVFRGGLENCSYPDLMMRFRPDLRKVNPHYLEMYLKSDAAVRFVRERATGTSGSMKKINQATVESIPVIVPSMDDQATIATAVGAWCEAIEKTEQLITAKEQRLNHLRDRLLRDPDQAKRTQLSAVTKELTGRNGRTLGRDSIMAVTKQVGMRPMREETIAASIERYKRVPPRGFAYNPMRLNIGSIAMSPFDTDVLVSPDYVVFGCDEHRLLPIYLQHLRFSRSWKSHFEVAGNGSVRVRIYYDDLGTFSFQLPPIGVQMRIAKSLDAAAREIELLTRQVGSLHTQMRGLMQKLFTGQWRLPLPAVAPQRRETA